MLERDTQDLVRLAVAAIGVVVFRNNQGVATMPDGSVLRFGVCNPGGSDLLGWNSVVITPEMVGLKVAVFTAIECKSPKGTVTAAQDNFLKRVRAAGGIAVLARSVLDAVDGVRSFAGGVRGEIKD